MIKDFCKHGRRLLLAAMAVAAMPTWACTNFIVGKKASVDGSVMC